MSNHPSWHISPLSELAKVERGRFSHRPRNDPAFYGGNTPFIQTGDVSNAKLGVIRTHSQTLNERGLKVSKVFPKGTLMVSIAANIGDAATLAFDSACPDSVIAITTKKNLNSEYLRYYLRNRQSWIQYLAPAGAQKNINVEFLEDIEVEYPPLPEQSKIAEILATWDEALTQLDALIEAQERRKKALMQQLLTGRRRLKGFDHSKGQTGSDRFGIYPADWQRVRLGEITREVATRNSKGGNLPVLSCTKHRGLVLSEEYFGKRVYAEDTSGYRVVQRSEFAYATNHIEEGSIGYQNLCDAGLVSPIYTVFKTTDAVDDSYLFRVLKSPLLIHLYQVNTSASVDRRGSLRYDEFSRIHIWLPSKAEQIAVAQVFATADQQLTLLRTQRTALDQQKRGLMQRLLTGKVRIQP